MVLIISIFFRKLDGWMSYDGMSSMPSRWLWPWLLSEKTTLSLQALTEIVSKSSPAWRVSSLVASLKNLEHSLSYEGMSWNMTKPLECYILSKIIVLSMETPTGTTVRYSLQIYLTTCIKSRLSLSIPNSTSILVNEFSCTSEIILSIVRPANRSIISFDTRLAAC